MSFRRYSAGFTAALFLLMAWALWEASAWDVQASLMAWLIGLPTAALLALQLVRQLMGRGENAPPGGGDDPLGAALAVQAVDTLDPAEERRRTAGIIAWVLGFAASIWLVGFQFGIGLATLLYLKSAGERWPAVIGITVAVLAGVVLVFDCGMPSSLPKESSSPGADCAPVRSFRASAIRSRARSRVDPHEKGRDGKAPSRPSLSTRPNSYNPYSVLPLSLRILRFCSAEMVSLPLKMVNASTSLEASVWP